MLMQLRTDAQAEIDKLEQELTLYNDGSTDPICNRLMDRRTLNDSTMVKIVVIIIAELYAAQNYSIDGGEYYEIKI